MDNIERKVIANSIDQIKATTRQLEEMLSLSDCVYDSGAQKLVNPLGLAAEQARQIAVCAVVIEKQLDNALTR